MEREEPPAERSSERPQENPSRLLDWFSERLNLTEIFSLLTSYGLFYAEVDNRKRIREALAEALAKPSPSYARGLRVFGLVVVVLLAFQALTGILLSLYYMPTPESAHSSVGTIMRDVDFGWLVHQTHYWGAQLLIAVLIIRLVRFFVQGVFRPPRELFWVLGALLLLVCFHADLTGRILPWTSEAYWSGVRAIEIVTAVPIYGDFAAFLIGGDERLITDLTLIRSYVLHVGILPVLALTFIYLHFSGVRRVGLTAVAGEASHTGTKLLRRHLVNLAILLTMVFGVLVSLALLSPISYPPKADPFASVPGIGPPWYLLAPFGFLELTSGWLPQWVAGSLIFLAFMAFLFVPFVVRSRRRSVVWGLAVGVIAVWVTLTFYGARVA